MWCRPQHRRRRPYLSDLVHTRAPARALRQMVVHPIWYYALLVSPFLPSVSLPDCATALLHSNDTSHDLYIYSSERPEIAYSLRTRNHNKFIIPKTSDLGDRYLSLEPFIKTYNDAILQIKLICHYSYVQFVTTALYCMYMCMNFVHSCVGQLFKNKRWDEMRLKDTAVYPQLVMHRISCRYWRLNYSFCCVQRSRGSQTHVRLCHQAV